MAFKDLVKWHILQQMPGFIAVLAEPNHVFEFVNDAYIRLAGLREYIGQPARRVFSDLDDYPYFEALDSVCRTGEAFEAKGMEFRYPDSDAPKFIDFRYQPILNESGGVAGIFVAGNDVTERVLAEQKLRDNESRLSALVQASSEVRYLMSADWSEMQMLSGGGFLADTTSANPNWLTEYIHADDQEKVREAIDAAITNGVPFQFEHRVLMADGSIGWTFSRAVPIRDADGKIIEWFGAASDVTAQHKAEESLHLANLQLQQSVALAYEERNLFADIIATTDVSVQVLDSDYRFLAINEATIQEYRKIYGFTAKIGDCLLDLVEDPRSKADIKNVWARVLSGENYVITAEFGDPGRGRRSYETRFRHLSLKGHGEIAYALSYDVTQRLEEQEHLRHVEGQLRQAQKMEAVGQLTGGLAHDFNNLLTGVMGNLELLSRKVSAGKPEGLERYIAGAQGAGRRAASLTQRLLAFARRQTLDPTPTDVNRLASGMLEMVERTVGPAIALDFVGAPDPWVVNIDSGQLENALLNVCIDARDAMPGGGRLTIETSNETLDEVSAREKDMQPGDYLMVCVTDTGTGMSPETIRRAFEPFYTTKPLGQGTGLGLSMIYGFARQSGGGVHIESQLGRGSEICIYLPRYHGAAETKDEAGSSSDDSHHGNGHCVLVVDDETAIRQLLVEVLLEQSYSVLSAPDGPSGLKILQGGAQVELLITDVGLPNGMNGRQVAEAAREIIPDLPVLFITGYAESAALDSGDLDEGMSLLTKPFSLDALAEKVRVILEA